MNNDYAFIKINKERIMNKLYYAIFLILLTSCMKADWEKVKAANSNITIEFPGKPIYETKTIKIPVVGRMKIDSYRLSKNNTVFFMQVTDTLDADISNDSLFDSTHVMKRQSTKSGGEIIRELETTTFGYDTYIINTKKRNGSITYRKIIKIKNQQYILSVYYKDGKDNYKEVEKFYNSFSI